MSKPTLYERLGGYDGIAAFVEDLLPRLQSDSLLGRFWLNRGRDGIKREKQLLISFLCAGTGGPMYYTGRGMKLSHEGMNISDADWIRFMGHAGDAMKELALPEPECKEIAAFVRSLRQEIVEA